MVSVTASHQKPSRIPTACKPCRQRKAKCNGQSPCQKCKDRGKAHDCVFISRRGRSKKDQKTQLSQAKDRAIKVLFKACRERNILPGEFPTNLKGQISSTAIMVALGIIDHGDDGTVRILDDHTDLEIKAEDLYGTSSPLVSIGDQMTEVKSLPNAHSTATRNPSTSKSLETHNLPISHALGTYDLGVAGYNPGLQDQIMMHETSPTARQARLQSRPSPMSIPDSSYMMPSRRESLNDSAAIRNDEPRYAAQHHPAAVPGLEQESNSPTRIPGNEDPILANVKFVSPRGCHRPRLDMQQQFEQVFQQRQKPPQNQVRRSSQTSMFSNRSVEQRQSSQAQQQKQHQYSSRGRQIHPSLDSAGTDSLPSPSEILPGNHQQGSPFNMSPSFRSSAGVNTWQGYEAPGQQVPNPLAQQYSALVQVEHNGGNGGMPGHGRIPEPSVPNVHYHHYNQMQENMPYYQGPQVHHPQQIWYEHRDDTGGFLSAASC